MNELLIRLTSVLAAAAPVVVAVVGETFTERSGVINYQPTHHPVSAWRDLLPLNQPAVRWLVLWAGLAVGMAAALFWHQQHHIKSTAGCVASSDTITARSFYFLGTR